MLISNAYAQAAAGGAGGPVETIMQFMPIILMFVVLYFLMIRPQMKRQKEHRAMLDKLAKGDEVITSGGVAGTVVGIGENFISVEVASGVQLKLQRGAVTSVLP